VSALFSAAKPRFKIASTVYRRLYDLQFNVQAEELAGVACDEVLVGVPACGRDGRAGKRVRLASARGRRGMIAVSASGLKGRVGFVFSGEAALQDSLGRSPRNCNKTGD
jgi:hypothetical protein